MGNGPRLIVVSGLPAAGKSTLARRLAADLGVPVVRRDGLRQGVGGWHDEPPAEPLRSLLPKTIDRLVETALCSFLDAGLDAIVDNNFNGVDTRDPIRRLVAARDLHAREVCLWGDPVVLRQRFERRAEPPITPQIEALLASIYDRERWTVLTEPGATLELDSTDLASVDDAYERIVEHALS